MAASSARMKLSAGVVIPAHPLALDASLQLDERRQRALTRYYLDAGSGGLAVGVPTTQFAIRGGGLDRPPPPLPVGARRGWFGPPRAQAPGRDGACLERAPALPGRRRGRPQRAGRRRGAGR